MSIDAYEWLQVDFRGMHVISAIETQGRFGNGQGKEFTEQYRVEYWRPEFTAWKKFKPEGREVS